MTEATASAETGVAMTEVDNSVEFKVGKDLTTATLSGTKIEITPDGDVVVYTSEGVQTKSADAAAAPEASADKQITIGNDFNSVAMYGAKVELTAEGSLVVSTHGKVRIKPVAANDTINDTIVALTAATITPPETKTLIEIGDVMADGTIYFGTSPTTHLSMFAAPADAPMCLDFNGAAKYAKKLQVGDKQDFRVPSDAELQVLRANLDKGALKGTFDQTVAFPGNVYWSSEALNLEDVRAQNLSSKGQSGHQKSTDALVRCIR